MKYSFFPLASVFCFTDSFVFSSCVLILMALQYILIASKVCTPLLAPLSQNLLPILAYLHIQVIIYTLFTHSGDTFPALGFGNACFSLWGMTGAVQSVWVTWVGVPWTQILASTPKCEPRLGKKRRLLIPVRGTTGSPASGALNKQHSHKRSKCSELPGGCPPFIVVYAHTEACFRNAEGRDNLGQMFQPCRKTPSPVIWVRTSIARNMPGPVTATSRHGEERPRSK